jgi:predicted Zn-dependent protease
MLESKGPDLSAEVITLLDKAHAGEGDSPTMWRLYAAAYGRQKQDGMVSLMLAEEAVQLGDIQKAHSFADKALKLLPKNKTASIQRALDIKSLDVPPMVERE